MSCSSAAYGIRRARSQTSAGSSSDVSLKDGQSPHGQVVDAKRVIEPRVHCTGVDQVRQPQLTDVTEALEGRGYQ